MAGQPDTQRRLALISEPENAEFILERMAAGESMVRIAVRISDKLEETIHHTLIGRWAQKPENAPLVAQARARAAEALAEGTRDDAHALVRDVALGLKGRDDIAASRHAAEYDRWIAGIWNAKYAPQTGAQLTVNIGAIHMDALRQAPAVERPRELQAFDVTDVEDTSALGTTGHSLTLDDLL